MRISTILRILGIMLMIFSFSMLTPILINWIYHDGKNTFFLISFALTFVTGFVFWLPCRNQHYELKVRDGFLIVFLFWVVLCFFGALPFILAKLPQVTITDAIFESVSGLTTTGSNAFYHLDQMTHSILYYRQQLQFLGGMGIIVLAVAILPMLGIGGIQLYRAETPGPVKDYRLTPRITETAKRLWYIYIILIVCCAMAFWIAGMPIFNAIGESFGTISTGGFAMYDSSFAHYHSMTIDIICEVFMILGATNFALHYLAFREKSIKNYWKNIEFRAFIFMLLIVALITVATLFYFHTYQTIGATITKGLFTVVSLGSTTGFTNAGFDKWPTFLPFLVMIIAIIGGCGSSTSGGLKMIRFLLMCKHSKRELKKLIHPQAIFSIKFDGESLPDQIIQAMWGFIAVYIMLYVVLLLLLLATGIDFTTAFGALTACLTNAGAGVGNIASSFDKINITSKWLLIFAMLAGRLEIFTILVLFMPSFWRK
jgi:trk system potassium uptake protein